MLLIITSIDTNEIHVARQLKTRRAAFDVACHFLYRQMIMTDAERHQLYEAGVVEIRGFRVTMARETV